MNFIMNLITVYTASLFICLLYMPLIINTYCMILLHVLCKNLPMYCDHLAGLPVFRRDPQDQFVNRTDKATFECFVNGSDSLTITWVKDSKPYTARNIITKDHSSTLKINRAAVADSGKYQCNATNADGNSVMSNEAELISNVHYIPNW